MIPPWNDREPIYRQLHSRVLAALLEGELPEGKALPSVRQTASDFSINHITVTKAYEELVADGLVEKKRGMGLFVCFGARKHLVTIERQRFFDEDLPAFFARLHQLGLTFADLPEIIERHAIKLRENE